jgi:hypothetical protein
VRDFHHRENQSSAEKSRGDFENRETEGQRGILTQRRRDGEMGRKRERGCTISFSLLGARDSRGPRGGAQRVRGVVHLEAQKIIKNRGTEGQRGIFNTEAQRHREGCLTQRKAEIKHREKQRG